MACLFCKVVTVYLPDSVVTDKYSWCQTNNIGNARRLVYKASWYIIKCYWPSSETTSILSGLKIKILPIPLGWRQQFS